MTDEREPEPVAEPVAEPATEAAAGDSAVPVAVSSDDAAAAAFFGDDVPEESAPASPDADLRAAVGAVPLSPREAARDDDDLDDDLRPQRPGRRRGQAIAVVLVLALVAVGVFAISGSRNAGHYRITCGASQLVPERGRSFPPWGSRAMAGLEWAPIAIPPSAECVDRQTDSRAQLETWYLAAISEQILARLTPRAGGGVTGENVDAASALLDQGLLLTRAPARREDRKELERLQGDVGYWRAFGKVEAAAAGLEDAAKGFAEAAGRRPRHATDAAEWAERARRAAEELRAGAGEAVAEPSVPTTAPAATVPATTEPAATTPVEAPAGAPLPIEPAAPAPAAPPDAAMPAGGVLL